MREIWDIAINQVSRQMRNRGVLISNIVVPILMIIFLGGALKGGTGIQLIDVVRPPAPASDLASDFVGLLQANNNKQVQNPVVVCDLANLATQPAECKLSGLQAGDEAAFAQQRLKDGLTIATITIPSTFSADLQAGTPSVPQIDANGITTTQSVSQFVGAAQTRLNGAVLAARVVSDQVPHTDADFSNKVYNAAAALWAKEPVEIEETTSTVTGTEAGTGFGQTAPGIGAMFVLTNALTLGSLFIEDRKRWTLQRMMVLPLKRAQLLAGKLLGQFIVSLLIFGVMIVVGTELGVVWGDWLGVIVVVFAYCLAVTALALTVSTFVRSTTQAVGISLLATMVLAPLGGAWWPLNIVPAWMRTVGQLSPIYWSQAAFSQMIFYGAHLPDVLLPVGVLLVFAAVFFGVGLARFRYE